MSLARTRIRTSRSSNLLKLESLQVFNSTQRLNSTNTRIARPSREARQWRNAIQKDLKKEFNRVTPSTTTSPLLETLKRIWYGRVAYPSPIIHVPHGKPIKMSSIPPPAATRKLKASDGPLVWIDCEMTGLNTDTDRIIEIALIITDGQLQPLDEGVSYIIRTPKEVLDNMNEWCIHQHGSSGLTESCMNDEVARHHADVRAAVYAYIIDRVPEGRVACLAGNSVHADAGFLRKEFPETINHLHYRIVDVSSIKELVRNWYGSKHAWSAKSSHRALDDIRNSIAELKYYRTYFFKKRPGQDEEQGQERQGQGQEKE